jgi:hypothetical protein
LVDNAALIHPTKSRINRATLDLPRAFRVERSGATGGDDSGGSPDRSAVVGWMSEA